MRPLPMLLARRWKPLYHGQAATSRELRAVWDRLERQVITTLHRLVFSPEKIHCVIISHLQATTADSGRSSQHIKSPPSRAMPPQRPPPAQKPMPHAWPPQNVPPVSVSSGATAAPVAHMQQMVQQQSHDQQPSLLVGLLRNNNGNAPMNGSVPPPDMKYPVEAHGKRLNVCKLTDLCLLLGAQPPPGLIESTEIKMPTKKRKKKGEGAASAKKKARDELERTLLAESMGQTPVTSAISNEMPPYMTHPYYRRPPPHPSAMEQQQQRQMPPQQQQPSRPCAPMPMQQQYEQQRAQQGAHFHQQQAYAVCL